VTRGLPEAPTIRAIATHPEHAETVYVGTQLGPYRSPDHGEHWERLNISDHGLPVWSLLFDPHDAKVLYAGYENCEIYRSEDGGEHWQQLPVTVRFPEVTVGPGANPAKRVLELAAHPATYALIEKEVARLTTHLAQYETIKRFALIDREFTFDGGELTFTLKLKRRVIEQRYTDVIERLYAQPSPVAR